MILIINYINNFFWNRAYDLKWAELLFYTEN